MAPVIWSGISNTGAVTGLTVGPHKTLSKEISASMKPLNILYGGRQNEESGEVILHTEQTYLKKNSDLFPRRLSDTVSCTDKDSSTSLGSLGSHFSLLLFSLVHPAKCFSDISISIPCFLL